MLSWRDLRVEFPEEIQKRRSCILNGSVGRGSIHGIFGESPNLSNSIVNGIATLNFYSGSIYWEGYPPPKNWFHIIGHFPSYDNLPSKLTIYEQIERSIKFRDWKCPDKSLRVEEILNLFGLESIKSRLIQSHYVKNALNQFERSRVIMATELVHRPSAIFIGSDFFLGLTLPEQIQFMNYLRQYVNLYKPVILISLSKFNEDLLRAFDSVSIVTFQRQIFSGKVPDAKEVISNSLQCPKQNAFTDIQRIFLKSAHCPSDLANLNALIERFPSQNPTPIESMEREGSSNSNSNSGRAPWYRQLYWMTAIQMEESFRSRKTILGLLVTNIIIFTLTEFVFFQLPISLDGLGDRAGLLYFLNFNTVTGNSLVMMVQFDRISRKIRHDRRLGWISTIPLIWSQFLAALPIRILLFLTLGTALYYITGLRTDGFQHLVVFIAELELLVMTSIALGILISTLMVRLEYGHIILPFLGVIFFIFGNLSTAPDATWILRWIQYASPIYYGFQCLIQNELSGTQADGHYNFLNGNSFNTMPMSACLAALAGFTLLYLFIACIIYHFRFPPFSKRK